MRYEVAKSLTNLAVAASRQGELAEGTGVTHGPSCGTMKTGRDLAPQRKIHHFEVQGMKRSHIIVIDPEILGGTPVFAGTRVPVKTLIDYLRAGHSLERFLEGFPTVRRAQAIAFLERALDAMVAGVAHASAA